MILITGANGQLGTELRYLLDERNVDYVAVDVAEMDITNSEMVEKVFAEVKPTLVYHCAAYTAVDAAEDTTWYDFAVEILKDSDVEVVPVDSSKFPAKAKRPLNSTMSLTKAKATGFVIPTWQDTLKEFYKQEVRK